MFLCPECHTKEDCNAPHMFRSRGRCEGCGQGAECVDCHAYRNAVATERTAEISIVLEETEPDGSKFRQGWFYSKDQRDLADEIFNVLVEMCRRPGNKRSRSKISLTQYVLTPRTKPERHWYRDPLIKVSHPA